MLSDNLLVEFSTAFRGDAGSYELRKRITEYLAEFAPERLDDLHHKRILDPAIVTELRRRIRRSVNEGHHGMINGPQGAHHGVLPENYPELVEAVILEYDNEEIRRMRRGYIEQIKQIREIIHDPAAYGELHRGLRLYWPSNWFGVMGEGIGSAFLRKFQT